MLLLQADLSKKSVNCWSIRTLQNMVVVLLKSFFSLVNAFESPFLCLALFKLHPCCGCAPRHCLRLVAFALLRTCAACGSNIDIGFVVKLVTLIGDHALVDVAEILDQNHTQGLLSVINQLHQQIAELMFGNIFLLIFPE